jgi:segregation and condensation protein B
MESQSLKSKIESLLFVSGKPLTLKQLAGHLETDIETLKPAILELFEEKKNTGVVLLDNNGEYQLATNPTNSPVVKNFLNSELREKLTEATVEVLAIISYRQPISKAEIEAIRGVNSQYSLRHLLMRGLIEKVPNPNDARGFLYQTTTEFLMHMGLSSLKDLPDFAKLVENIKLPQTPATNTEPVATPETEEKVLEPKENLAIPPVENKITEAEAVPTSSTQENPTLPPLTQTEETAPAENTEEKEDEFDDEDEDEDDDDEDKE